MNNRMVRVFLAALTFVAVITKAEEKSADASGKDFLVMTYNVENLFDVDRVAKFDDYIEIPDDPNSYGPTKLLGKLRGIGKVLQSMQAGQGPEILLLNEIEIDFTPESRVDNYDEFLAKHAGTTAEKMLTTELNDELRGLPAEAWLIKYLEDLGMKGYRPAVGRDYPDPSGRDNIAQKNVVLSRLPILEHVTHETPAARGVLEAKIDLGGKSLVVLVNHWKSQAGNPAAENQRLGNAETVRKRLDEILARIPLPRWLWPAISTPITIRASDILLCPRPGCRTSWAPRETRSPWVKQMGRFSTIFGMKSPWRSAIPTNIAANGEPSCKCW